MSRRGRFSLAPNEEDEVTLLPLASSAPATHIALGIVEDADQTALIREVWGDAILAEPAKVKAILHAQEVCTAENSKLLRAAVAIGLALIDARQKLTELEFNKGLRESRRVWRGWSRTNVIKLIAVAEFWNRHRLGMRDSLPCPQHYTTLYEFTVLDDNQFSQAREIGLFRPDVRRTDIQAFKARLHTEVIPEVERNPFTAEIGRLNARLDLLHKEIERVTKRRDEMQQKEGTWKRGGRNRHSLGLASST